MRPLLEDGRVFAAQPPLYTVKVGDRTIHAFSEEEKLALTDELTRGNRKAENLQWVRFKGLGEMDAKDLKDTTMNPATRKLIRVSIDEDAPGETGDLVERLMGKKPELRFQYISENARFVEELDV